MNDVKNYDGSWSGWASLAGAPIERGEAAGNVKSVRHGESQEQPMDVEPIRKMRRAEPFSPFRLIMVDGHELTVDKPYFLAIAPHGAMLYSTTSGAFERFGPQHVKGIAAIGAGGGAANGSGGPGETA